MLSQSAGVVRVVLSRTSEADAGLLLLANTAGGTVEVETEIGWPTLSVGVASVSGSSKGPTSGSKNLTSGGTGGDFGHWFRRR